MLTAVFNWLTSFGVSAVTLLLPLTIQWWPRRERGRALGTRGIFIGSAMLIMWLVTGWMAGAFWPAAVRYPVLWIGLMSLVFLLLADSRVVSAGVMGWVNA